MRRFASLVVVAATLVAFSAVPGGGIASAAPCGAYWQLETFHIEAAATKRSYARGTAAVFNVNVTRPAHRDPADAGVEWGEPPASAPASGVEVSASFWYGSKYLFNKGLTDDEGNVTLRVKVPTGGPAGPVDVDFTARMYYNRGGCPDGEEMGYRRYPGMIKLT